MKWYRIHAMLMRNLYLYKRSFPRMLDIFYWPILELLLWGFISKFLESNNFGGVNIVTILLGAIILWDLLNQSQKAVSIAFLEELWEKNFLNIFVTPLKESEFLTSSVLLGIIRVGIVASVMAIFSLFLYSFNIFRFGFALIPFLASLLIFGWILGFFTIAIILRYGTSAQVLAWGFLALIQPFSAVFYPVSVLPGKVKYIAYALPTTHVFEGMRQIISTGVFPWASLGWSFLLNAIYMILVLIYFHWMFRWVKKKGLLAKLDY